MIECLGDLTYVQPAIVQEMGPETAPAVDKLIEILGALDPDRIAAAWCLGRSARRLKRHPTAQEAARGQRPKVREAARKGNGADFQIARNSPRWRKGRRKRAGGVLRREKTGRETRATKKVGWCRAGQPRRMESPFPLQEPGEDAQKRQRAPPIAGQHDNATAGRPVLRTHGLETRATRKKDNGRETRATKEDNGRDPCYEGVGWCRAGWPQRMESPFPLPGAGRRYCKTAAPTHQ